MKSKPKAQFVPVQGGLSAVEIPNAGCIVKSPVGLVFLRDVAIVDGELKGLRQVESIISFTTSASPAVETKGTSTGTTSTSYHWIGDAGDKLVEKLKARNLIDELNKFIQKTWKITPTVKQLSALKELLERV